MAMSCLSSEAAIRHFLKRLKKVLAQYMLLWTGYIIICTLNIMGFRKSRGWCGPVVWIYIDLYNLHIPLSPHLSTHLNVYVYHYFWQSAWGPPCTMADYFNTEFCYYFFSWKLVKRKMIEVSTEKGVLKHVNWIIISARKSSPSSYFAYYFKLHMTQMSSKLHAASQVSTFFFFAHTNTRNGHCNKRLSSLL